MNPIDALIAEYIAWNKANGLHLGSADEHWYDERLTDEQRAWVRDFSRRWDDAVAMVNAWAAAEAEEFGL